MVTLPSGKQLWVAEAGGSATDGGRELVLCIHGMTGDATNWTDFIAELVPDFDCKAVDLSGSGFSPPPRTTRGYSISCQAATVIELIESLGAGPVHLVGNSMGGAVSVRVAARRPDLIRTLTLISPAMPDRKPHRQTMHFPLIALPLLGDRLVRQFSRFPARNRITGVLSVCYYDASTIHPARLELSIEELSRRDGLPYDAVSVARSARTLVIETFRPTRFSLWHDAERVKAPALVLFGSHDQLVSPDLAGKAARAFAGARVLVLPHTGHLGQMEHPETVASLFREMVAQARRGGDPWTLEGNSGRRAQVDA
jgi:pimeloyl-ACP methyl ester carboxylesterase